MFMCVQQQRRDNNLQ